MANTTLVTEDLFGKLLAAGRRCNRRGCGQPILVGQRVYRVAFDEVYHVSADCTLEVAREFAGRDPETIGRGPGCRPWEMPADEWGEND